MSCSMHLVSPNISSTPGETAPPLQQVSGMFWIIYTVFTHTKDHICWRTVPLMCFFFDLCCRGSSLFSSRQSDPPWWVGPGEDLHPVCHLSPAEALSIQWPWTRGAAWEPGCCSRQSVLSLGVPGPAGLHHGGGARGLDHSSDRPGHLGFLTGHRLVWCEPEQGTESRLGRWWVKMERPVIQLKSLKSSWALSEIQKGWAFAGEKNIHVDKSLLIFAGEGSLFGSLSTCQDNSSSFFCSGRWFYSFLFDWKVVTFFIS